MCQCDTDAPVHGHCLREKVFLRDVIMGQDIRTRVELYAPLKLVGLKTTHEVLSVSLSGQILYSKTCVKRSLSKRPQIGFESQLSLNAGQMYCRIISTFIKLPFVIKIFVLSIFE